MEFIIETLGVIADFLLIADYKSSFLKRVIEITVLTVCFVAFVLLLINLAIAASTASYIGGMALFTMASAFTVVYFIILYDLVIRRKWSKN